MPDVLRMNRFQGIKNLGNNHKNLILGHGIGLIFQLRTNRLPVDIVHDIIDCPILFEQIVHPDYMFVVQVTQPLSFLPELVPQAFKRRIILRKAHRHILTLTRIDTTHKELFHGQDLVKGGIQHLVGIAEATICYVTHYFVSAIAQQGAQFKHCTCIHLLFVFCLQR